MDSRPVEDNLADELETKSCERPGRDPLSGRATWREPSAQRMNSCCRRHCCVNCSPLMGANLGHHECKRRRYLVGIAGPPFDLTFYAFIAGLPKAFQLPQGYCINPNQTRRSYDDEVAGIWPTGLRSLKQHNLPPTADDLPWTSVCENTKDALQAQHPPYPGRFCTMPYVLGPQWGLDAFGTLQHNLKTLKKPQPPGRPNPTLVKRKRSYLV